jgi:hypothetical protein
MFDRLYTHQYISLPREIRDLLTKELGIVRTGACEIRDETLISDGTTNENLETVTKEILEQYTGKTGTFSELWHAALEKAEDTLNPKAKKVVEDAKAVVEDIINIEEKVEDVKETTKKSK